jgi:hypothetical protein
VQSLLKLVMGGSDFSLGIRDGVVGLTLKAQERSPHFFQDCDGLYIN